jgi:hypothetical protein
MNVSSRWCVTALFALGALACSDPVPPPAQGAFIASVGPAPITPPMRACPTSAFTYDVPAVRDMALAEVLDADNYTHKIINGQSEAKVSCSVKGGGSAFTFSGEISQNGKALTIASGTLGADQKGTATITVTNQQRLSPAQLISPAGACAIDAARAAGNSFEVAAGRIWAHFKCSSVELTPSSYCGAEGYFVLENCEQ